MQPVSLRLYNKCVIQSVSLREYNKIVMQSVPTRVYNKYVIQLLCNDRDLALASLDDVRRLRRLPKRWDMNHVFSEQ